MDIKTLLRRLWFFGDENSYPDSIGVDAHSFKNGKLLSDISGDELTFFTSITGERYARIYLGVLLQSIDEVYRGECNIVVSYGDISDALVEEMHEKVPYVIWVRSPIGKLKAKLQRDRAALKLKTAWSPFVNSVENNRMVLMDADMALIKDVRHFFDDDFDLGYTYFDDHMTAFGDVSKTKSGKHVRLNTGIILVKDSRKANTFFKKWSRVTNDILKSKRNDLMEEWGAADQAALALLLETDDHSGVVDKDGVKLKGFLCKHLNECECRPVTEETHVIHYKGRWRPILPDGTFDRLTEEQRETRNKEICYEQYLIWRGYYDRWSLRRAAGDSSKAFLQGAEK